MRLAIHAISAFFCLVVSASAQIKISEVMFDPAGDESKNEFIELYNISQEQAFDLRQIRIGDEMVQELINVDSLDSFLAPGQFAIIFDSDYIAAGGIYADLIPATARLLHITDKTLGSAGLSNSKAETILLIDVNGDTLDAYQYTLDNMPGFSDECVDPRAPAGKTVWGNSTSFNGTPGAINSLTLQNYQLDLSAELLLENKSTPRPGLPCILKIQIKNGGTADLQNLELVTSVNDSVLFQTMTINNLLAGDIQAIEFNWTPATAGSIQVTVHVESPTMNMKKNWMFWIEWPAQCIVINEVMFAPATGEPEWLEIYNRSTLHVDLNQMRIRDASGRQGLLLSTARQILQPQAYAIFTADSIIRSLFSLGPEAKIYQLKGFPALNNSGETVALLGKSGAPVDSIAIAVNAEKGVSLERVNADSGSTTPDNWQFCVADAGATPARVNSVSPLQYDLAIDTMNVVWYPEVPKRGAAVTIEIPVMNKGKNAVALKSWQLTDPRDAFLYAYKNERVILQPGAGTSIEISFTPLVSGEARFVFEAEAERDLRLGNNKGEFSFFVSFLRGDLVFNEIMATPAEGQPEWIEIVNRTEQSIDLTDWQISDPATSGVMQSNETNLKIVPRGFALISQSVPFTFPLSVPLFTLDKWPTLNNDGDQIVLKDKNGMMIDSLDFSLKNDAARGVSLENMNPFLTPQPANGWSYCVAEAGSTPGTQNSLYVSQLPEKGTMTLTPNPFSPDNDGVDDDVLIQYTLPLQTSNVNLFVFDIRGRQVRKLLNNVSSGPTRSVFWDGRDDSGHVLEMGIYIVYIQSLNSLKGQILQLKKPVILAKKL